MAYINGKEVMFSSIINGILNYDLVTSKGADLAEVGCWVDYNPNAEDRLYRFVSIAGATGKEIKIADASSQIVGTSNIINNVGFLGGYTEGDEKDSSKVIVSLMGVVPVKTNDITIVANDRVMSDDNGYAVKSTNNCGYRVLEVLENGLLNIVVSPNTDMVQRIKTDMDGKQEKLTAGDNITIDENNVISATGIKTTGIKTLYEHTITKSDVGDDGEIVSAISIPLGAEYTEISIETIAPADETRAIYFMIGDNISIESARTLAFCTNNIYTSARYFRLDTKCYGNIAHNEWLVGNKGNNNYLILSNSSKSYSIIDLGNNNGISHIVARVSSGTFPIGTVIRIGGRE